MSAASAQVDPKCLLPRWPAFASNLCRTPPCPGAGWALRVSWVSSELTGGPPPPRATPPRSIALCAARRCVAALDRLAACRSSRLGQLSAARRPTSAWRHSTSGHRAMRSSPLRRGPWLSRGARSVSPSAAQLSRSKVSRRPRVNPVRLRPCECACA